jgi:hypothetical protein
VRNAGGTMGTAICADNCKVSRSRFPLLMGS